MNVGIVGGGQLGRMLALAGYPLGVRCRFLEPASESSAAQVGERVQGDFEDYQALFRFVQGLNVVTLEFENVPVESARWLAERAPVWPPSDALAVAQDRLAEKKFFHELNIPVPPFAAVETRSDYDAALREVGLPAVLKTRRFGYDGKGQFVIRNRTDADHAWEVLGGRPLILEGFVPFRRELSILAVRGTNGEEAFYPLVQNEHRDGMLRRTQAPAPDLTPDLQAKAEGYARRALEALGYAGVLAIELFEVEGGELLVNEMAPRVHNSGHWTIEGAETSQFENHLRAVLGWPLGSTGMVGVCEMWNLIGSVPDAPAVLSVPGAHLHLYGKRERPNRKLGHVTVRAADRGQLAQRISLLRERIGPEGR